MNRIITTLLLLITSNSILAANYSAATLEELSSDPYWLSLLRIKNSHSSHASDITSKDYFLSPTGINSSLEELEVSVNELFNDVNVNDSHPRCRFPERYRWLSKKLNRKNIEEGLRSCKEFNEWANLEQIKSASLIYASGYLNNPASFFGHILLKFDYADQNTKQSLLLDNSVNFGAAIPPEDSSIEYVFKGFFGGYFAAFKDDYFYRHHKVYAEQESRTLWQYKLNLNEEELKSLVAHTWELREKKFDYYYLNDNCASRVAELLQVIKPEWSIKIDTPWVQPLSVFKTLAENNENPFRSITHVPSNYQTFLNHYEDLTELEKKTLVDIDTHNNFSSISYQKLPEQSQVRVIETFLHYLNYKKATGDESVNSLRAKTLGQRFALPISKQNTKFQNLGTPPHISQQPSTTRFLTSYSSNHGVYGSIMLRPTYYDLLGIEQGRLPHSSLEMGTLNIEFNESKIYLKRFDLANIFTLSPAQTSLESESSLAWKVRVGLENTNDECLECLMIVNEIGIGKAYKYKGSVFYSLVEAKVQTRQSYQGYLSTAARFGTLIDVNEQWKTSLELVLPISGWDKGSKGSFEWNNRFGNSSHYDWRLNIVSTDNESKLELGYSYYWQ